MGISTRVYQLDGDLAINIPTETLPEPTIAEIEDVIEIPGYLAETTTTVPILVRETGRRIALMITPTIATPPHRFLENLGLNPYEQIWIRFPYKREWIPAHHYGREPGGYLHVFYGRVWIPDYLVRELNLRKHTVYPVFIRGTTFPEKRIRIIRKPIRRVIIDHMDKTYKAEEYAPDRYRWIIPHEIESHPVLLQGFKMIPPIYPLAECHRQNKIIYVDFFYYSEGARKVSNAINYAYRSLACRNYTAAATVELGYPLLIEIRCSFISSMPKRFYQIKERAVYEKKALTLKQAIETCVYNLLQYFFTHAKQGKYSTVSYAEHMGKIEFTTEKVNLQRKYPRLKNVPRISSLGETTTESWNILEYPYYRAIKYIRVVNEYCYKNQDFTRYIYTNDDVERVLYQNEERRIEAGLPRAIWIDDRGFVWRTFADEK